MIRTALTSIDWPTLMAFMVMFATLEGIVFAVVRSRLREFFVSRRDHDVLAERVGGTERALLETPRKLDFERVLERLGAGQAKFEAIAEQIGGVGRAVNRVENQLDMVLRAQIEKENKA